MKISDIKFEDLEISYPDLTERHDDDGPYTCRAAVPPTAVPSLKIISIKYQLMRDRSFINREIYTISSLSSTRTNRRLQSARGHSATISEIKRQDFENAMGAQLKELFWGRLIEAGWKMNDQRGIGGDVHWLPPWRAEKQQ